MSQNQSATTTTVKMVYSGRLKEITLPLDSKYEDFLKSAIERFSIPAEVKDHIQVLNEVKHVFQKETFEYFLLLFPNPDRTFYLDVDYSEVLANLKKKRKPFSKSHNNKRKFIPDDDDDEAYIGVSVSRQSSFIGCFPGMNSESEPKKEPKAKRQKTAAAVRKISSRKHVRM